MAASTLGGMLTDPGGAALFADLALLNSDPVLRTTSAALGVTEAEGQRVDGSRWPAIAGHYVEMAEGEVLTAYVVVTGRHLVRHQMARNGRTMTVCVGLSRVRRVLEERTETGLAVAVELDADRTTVDLDGALVNDRQVVASGALTSSGYVIATDDEGAAVRLGAFATALRAELR